MIESIRKKSIYIAALLLLLLIVAISGKIIIRRFDLAISPASLLNLSILFALINLVTLVIVFAGQAKDRKVQPGYTMFAISLKLLAEMVIALLWFMGEKNSTIPDVILFFLLYLTFSLFSILSIVKTLKNKAL